MSLPYFPMYPTDFEAKTAHLTLAEDGAYNRLLRLQWSAPSCKLPADLPWIMRKMRAVSEADQAIVRGIISEFFTKKGGKIFNDRLLKEWVKSSAANERRILAGAKGGIAKALKSKETGSSNAVAMLKQPEPEPEPVREEEPKGSLSPDSDLTEAVAAYNETAGSAGWPRVQVLNKARKSALKQRLHDCGGILGWRDALARARASPHCCGQNDRGWTASFDFLTQASSFAKLMEGNYDPRPRPHRIPEGPERVDPAIAQFARLAGLGQA